MQFTTVAAAAAVLGLAAAAPAPAPATTNMMAAGQWSLQKFTRTCNSANTQCKFSYNIYTGSGSGTPCAYTVNANNAADANYGGIHCGAFTISSGWSGQFGPGNGFTTLAVTNQKQIIYPAYTDKQLQNGKTVTPDQSYTPQNLP